MSANLSVLRKEAAVIKALRGRRNVVHMLASARSNIYSYLVMILFGKSLGQLRLETNTG